MTPGAIACHVLLANDASEVITSEYNVISPPTVVIVDAKGNIVDRFLGTLVGVNADLIRLTS